MLLRYVVCWMLDKDHPDLRGSRVMWSHWSLVKWSLAIIFMTNKCCYYFPILGIRGCKYRDVSIAYTPWRAKPCLSAIVNEFNDFHWCSISLFFYRFKILVVSILFLNKDICERYDLYIRSYFIGCNRACIFNRCILTDECEEFDRMKNKK